MVKPKKYGLLSKISGTIDDLTEKLRSEVAHIVKDKVLEGLLETGENPDNYVFETVIKQCYMSEDGNDISDTKSVVCYIPYVTIGVKATEVMQ